MAYFCLNIIVTVNATNTNVIIFRKGGRVNRNIRFLYKENVPEIVSKIKNLGIVFYNRWFF